MLAQYLSRSYLHCSQTFFSPRTKLQENFNSNFEIWEQRRANSFIGKKLEGFGQSILAGIIGAPVGYFFGNLLQRAGESGYRFLGGIIGGIIGPIIAGLFLQTKIITCLLAAIEAFMQLIKMILGELSELCLFLFTLGDLLLQQESIRFFIPIPFIIAGAWIGPTIFGAIFNNFIPYDAEDNISSRQIGEQNGAWIAATIGYLIAQPLSKLTTNILAAVIGSALSIGLLLPHTFILAIYNGCKNYCGNDQNNAQRHENYAPISDVPSTTAQQSKTLCCC